MKKIHILLSALLLPAVMMAQLPYQNPSLSPEERAEDLVHRLTVEEKWV